jgi:hypothetical protein
MKTLISILLILAVIGCVIWYTHRGTDTVDSTNTTSSSTNSGSNNNSNTGGTNSGGTNTGSNTTNPDIKITSPKSGDTITSPLIVTGQAKGSWFFEASFPVKLLDANGKVIVQGPAQAQGEWMTSDFVQFKATLSFANPTTSTGTLVLSKDNPSGLPQNDAQIVIPVKFNVTQASNRPINIYLYNEAKDKDASGNVLCSAQGLETISKNIPFTNTPIQDAVKALFAMDPKFVGVTLSSASLSNGVLTLAINDPNHKTSGGSCKVNILKVEVEATAKQFGQVTSVRYTPTGVFQP